MAALPTYRPQLARLVKAAPEGDAWLHEMKYDGYRIGCRISGNTVRLISRSGKDWTAAFPEIAAAARELGVRTNTSVAAFSSRARAGAPVSVPVRWDEVTAALDPQAWTVVTVEKRLARLRQDPWKDYWKSKQRLPRAAIAAVRAL